MNKITFSDALQLMKQGKAVARQGWRNSAGQFDTCVVLNNGDFQTVHREVDYGWTPSAEEMLADDWEPVIVSEAAPAIPEEPEIKVSLLGAAKPGLLAPQPMKDGVYLVTKDNRIIPYGNPADYTGRKFVGVALKVGDMAIRIALKDQVDVTLTNRKDDGETGTPCYIDDWDNARCARQDGKADTEHIKAVGTDIELAPDEYIPSLYELYQMFIWKAILNGALEFIGGDPLEDEVYWSSTEYSSTTAWYLDFSNGNQYICAKASNRIRVRPVSAL